MTVNVPVIIGKVALGLALASAAFSSAAAQSAGEYEYFVACSGCHGESGKGNGPFTEWLSIDAPDLTGLSAANRGEFPYLDVFMVIDGRTGVRGHGTSMPIWGDRYKASASELGVYGAEVMTRGRIATLVDYIESIQE